MNRPDASGPGGPGSPGGPPWRFATWNVNSIRTRGDQVLAWLTDRGIDVACLQETKCDDATFPTAAFEEIGYAVAHHGHDHWNGVAIVSRLGLDGVRRGFSGPQRAPYDEARLLAATCGGIRVWSVYVPNGRALDDPHYLYKLVWLERLRGELMLNDAAAVPTLVAGDFNVAPTDLDIYDPARWRRRTHASPPERAAIAALVDLGLVDVTREHLPGPGIYTWWNYRTSGFARDQGLRIDLALCSAALAGAVTSVSVDREIRAAPRPSDHAPLVCEIDPARIAAR